ncbi:MAG: dTDP-4-dehydrorhamnose reductase [Balneolaceae bacterium]
MKYLITGAGGQLGKQWVEFLDKEKKEFTAFDSSQFDITDYRKTDRIFRKEEPEIVINCAAYTDVDGAEDHPIIAFKTNKDAVAHIAKKCLEFNACLIHFSTDYVFPGRNEDMSKYPEGYPEEAETGPKNVYGKSKLAGEKAIYESGVHYIVIRISWLCGKYGNNFVKTMLRLSESKKNLRVVNDQFGSPTFTDGLVAATQFLIDKKMAGTYHFTSRGIISWFDYASAIFEIKKKDINLEPVSSTEFNSVASRPAFSKLSTLKIESLNSDLVTGWRAGLEKLLKSL